MLEAFVNKILSLAPVQIIEEDGIKYSTDDIYPIKEPMPAALNVNTLTGLSDYLENNKDGLKPEEITIQVDSPTQVHVYTALTAPLRQRATYINANALEVKHTFGRFIPVQDFIIWLQSSFVADDTTAQILKLVGNITSEAVAQTQDDGRTQNVTVRQGVARREDVDLPPIVQLKPFRTFNEINQPVGAFLLRIEKGSPEQSPKVALYEADGGAWRMPAMLSIKKWLKDKHPPITVLA
jgi:hypothetical protein